MKLLCVFKERSIRYSGTGIRLLWAKGDPARLQRQPHSRQTGGPAFVCKRGVVFDRRPDERVLRSAGLVTIFLVYASDAQRFDVRKALASGGALEDPAIGVAAAAFAGYLRDLDLAARRCD